jgi:iron complex transport system substrate-binding protein
VKNGNIVFQICFNLLLLLFFAPFAYPADYKRIISLAPSVTESLYELGLDREVAAITIYCRKGETPKEIIGTLLEPDLEKIIMLKPDLIISTKEGNNKAAIEKIQRLGFDIFVMETAGNFDEICANFKDLAKKVGRDEEAAKLISEAKDEIRSIYSHTMLMPRESVFWEVGAKPLYTAGRQSFVNDYNYYTSTINIYEDIDIRYPSIGIEDVIERNPDIIILVNMGDISADEIKEWKKYPAVSAVQNNRIYMLDANDIFTPTPSTFAKGVRIIAKALFPEIIK